MITDSQIRNARSLIEGRDTAAPVTRDFEMSRATFYRRARALGFLPEQSPADDTLTIDDAK